MNWSNLKVNKCPKCNKAFNYTSFKPGFIICGCGFSIRNNRMAEIVNSQVTQDLQEKWDLGEDTQEL